LVEFYRKFNFFFDIDTKFSKFLKEFFERIFCKTFGEDVNDNAPYFRDSIISLNIPESAAQNVRIEFPELRAIDEDIGQNGRISYSVLPIGYFKIEDDDFRTFLIPTRKIDREQMAGFQGTVIARDGGGRKAQAQSSEI